MPVLEAASKALDILDRKIISEIKGNNNPHEMVRLALECVNIMLGEKTEWDAIKKVLADTSLLTKLKNYDVYKISPKIEADIKKKLKNNPDFLPKQLASINIAAKVICEWVHAIV